jgi:hypothetical protein
MSLPDQIGAAASEPTIAGIFGALLSLRWAPGPTWLERFFCFGCGIACAVYAAPALLGYMGVEAAWAPRLFSFLFGLLGMNLIAKTVDTIRSTDWVTVFTSIRSKKS